MPKRPRQPRPNRDVQDSFIPKPPPRKPAKNPVPDSVPEPGQRLLANRPATPRSEFGNLNPLSDIPPLPPPGPRPRQSEAGGLTRRREVDIPRMEGLRTAQPPTEPSANE